MEGRPSITATVREPSPRAGAARFNSIKPRFPIPGLAEPLLVKSATARLDGARLWVDKMVARVGTVDLQGEYRYEPEALVLTASA